MNRVIVGTAGHIDHGKSALVLALTGTDPDRLPEEKARGITIDLGFAHAEWEGITFSFVDVPGHERFVKTMVAGAQGIDVALLVVAADDAVMPQTREHLHILGLLGVRAGVVARTKSDLVDQETGTLVDDEVRELVARTFLEGAPLVAVSSVTGAGLPELRAALAEAARRLPRGEREKRVPRLAIDRAFTMKGFGPVVTGTLDGGRMALDDRLVLHPDGLEVRVRRIEVHGEARPEARAGERTSLNLAGVDRAALRRGQTLYPPGALAPSPVLTVELELLPGISAPLRNGARLRLHHGTGDIFARVSLLGGRDELAPSGRAFAQLFAEGPVAALRGDRFILRRPSPVETLGGGRVLDTGRGRVPRRGNAAATLQRLAEGDAAAVAALFLEEAGPRGLEPAELARRLGVPRGDAAAHLDALSARGQALRVTHGLLAAASAAVAMAERADALFAERRRTGSPTLAFGRGEFLEKLGRGLPAATTEGWLAILAAAKKLVADGDRVAPPGAGAAALADDAAGFAARIADGYRAAGFDPPRSFELAKVLGTKPPVVEGLVTHLLKAGTLVRLSPDLVVHREVVAECTRKLEAVRGRTMSVGEFRDLFGLSRKSLIPLLEYLDRQRKTRRQGDVRIVC